MHHYPGMTRFLVFAFSSSSVIKALSTSAKTRMAVNIAKSPAKMISLSTRLAKLSALSIFPCIIPSFRVFWSLNAKTTAGIPRGKKKIIATILSICKTLILFCVKGFWRSMSLHLSGTFWQHVCWVWITFPFDPPITTCSFTTLEPPVSVVYNTGSDVIASDDEFAVLWWVFPLLWTGVSMWMSSWVTGRVAGGSSSSKQGLSKPPYPSLFSEDVFMLWCALNSDPSKLSENPAVSVLLGQINWN